MPRGLRLTFASMRLGSLSVLALFAALAVPAAAFGQASDLESEVKAAIKKSAEFLLSKQSNKLRLVRNAFTNRPEFIDIDAKWGDVIVVKGTTTVRVKGREYTDIEVVLPPGWFAPEPPMSDIPRTTPPPPGYGDINPYYGGTTALCVTALLSTRDYQVNKDPRIRMALECLANIHTEAGAMIRGATLKRELVPGIPTSYVNGVHAGACELAYRRGLTGPLRDALVRSLTEDAKKLSVGIGPQGFSYMMHRTDIMLQGGPKHDLSNTQYAMLGLWAAARANIEFDQKVWDQLNKLLLDSQNRDGGWPYSPEESKSTQNMTGAGLAGMFILMDQVHTRTRGHKGPDITPFTNTPMLMRTIQSVERGLEHFGRNYKFDPESYFLYGVERIGASGGHKYFGDHDWFMEGAREIMKSKRGDGTYNLRGFGAVVDTALTVLFLVHGQAPVLVNKLRYGPSDDWQWNNYPRDAVNLTRWYDRRFEQDCNWQIVKLHKDKEDDLFDSHVLYITGYKDLPLTDEEAAMLRRYCDRGGTLLFATAGGKVAGRKFIDSVVALNKRMYPPAEFPEFRLSACAKDHPINTMHVTGDPKTKPQRGLGKIETWHAHNGHRSFMFLVTEDVNHLWHTNKWLTREEVFQLFANVRSYAGDRGPLPSKFRRALTDGLTPMAARGEIKLGLVKYASQGVVNLDAEPGKVKKEAVPAANDWAGAVTAWADSREWIRAVTGYELRETKGVSLADPALKNLDVLHMTGHYGFKLTNDELFGLKAFLIGGGTLLIDAAGGHDIDGHRKFHESAQAMLRELFTENRAEELSTAHAAVTGKLAGGAGFDCTAVSYSRATALQRPDLTTPALRVIKLENRPAVFLSQLDLACGLGRQPSWEREGYSAKSARELVANILMFAKESRAGK